MSSLVFSFDPVALKCFQKLGVDANDVLQMHGYPRSGLGNIESKSGIPDLLEMLTKDLVFLISARGRWREPTGEDSSVKLQYEVSAQLPLAMALLCGKTAYASLRGNAVTCRQEYLENSDYVCIEAPSALNILVRERQPILPVFSYAQIIPSDALERPKEYENLRSESEALIRTLCPVQVPGKKDAWNVVEVMIMKGNKIFDRDQKMGKWVTGYVRARCRLKAVDDLQKPKSKKSTVIHH